MNLAEYTPLAMTTASPSAGDHGVSADLVHAVLGIADEAHELLEAKTPGNIIEECGDLLWFCALVDNVLQSQIFERHSQEPEEGVTPYDIATAALKLSGLIKKPYAYGNSLPVAEIERELLKVISAVEAITERLNIDMSDVMELNLIKLKMRYPERFSHEAAIRRNLANEQALFEHWRTLLPIILKSDVWFLCRKNELEDAKAYLGLHFPGTSDTKYIKPECASRPAYWLAYALTSPAAQDAR